MSGVDTIARAIAGQNRVGLRTAQPVPQVAIIGDSITAPDYNGADRVTPVTQTNVLRGANGILTWALALAGQRVKAPTTTNIWSFPGQETGVILANLPAFLAQMPVRPGAMVVECGTNNIYHNTATGTVASITADWTAIAAYLTAQGIRTLFVPILPRTSGFSTLFTAAQFDVMDRCNRWLNRFAQGSGNWVAVASACLADVTDPASVGAQPKANYTVDGTHPGITGAYYIGKAVAAILRHWFPPLDLLPASNAVWSAAAPFGNMVQNPMMVGGSGTVTQPGAGTLSGTAPTGWTAGMSNTAGLTVACSQLVSPVSGTPMHQFAFSGSYTVSGSSAGPTYAHFARLVNTPPSAAVAGIAAGDTVEALIAFEIDAGASAIATPTLEMRWGGSAAYNRDLHYGPRELPGEAIAGVMRTPPYTFAATPAAGNVNLIAYVYLRSNPDGAVSPAGNVRFGRAVLQKVEG